MSSITVTSKSTKTGYAITGLASLFLVVDAFSHIVKPQVVKDSFRELGLPLGTSIPIAVVLLVCLALHLHPRTNILGAVLVTGYLGGAVAINMRAAQPLVSTVLFPLYLGILLWAGLWLRDATVRSVMPLRHHR